MIDIFCLFLSIICLILYRYCKEKLWMEVKGLKHLPHRLVLNQSGFQKLLALAHDVPHEHV